MHGQFIGTHRPLECIPECFIEKEVELDMYMRGNFEMIPFGTGRRECPGASLAITVVQTTLARFLQSFDWFLPDGRSINTS